MAIIGNEELGLNNVVSESTNSETDGTTIEVTEVEIGAYASSEVIISNDEKIDKIDFKKLKEILYSEQKEFDTHEEQIKEYQKEFVKIITEINISDVVEDSTNVVIKLNSNVTDLSYLESFSMDEYIKYFLEETKQENKEYIKNVINNLNRDYYKVMCNHDIEFLYIQFDENFNDIGVKDFILYVLTDLKDTFEYCTKKEFLHSSF